MTHLRSWFAVLALSALATVATLPACSGGSETGECSDGADNDNDGNTDSADPDCTNGDVEDPAGPECSDGIDNDNDGMTDAADESCTDVGDDSEDGAAAPQCNDRKDNDGDGKVDFPADPGCFSANQDDEADDCPDGPNCPQCADGDDNDGNSSTDFPDDLGCTSASDDDEFTSDPIACGASVSIIPLPAGPMVTGTLPPNQPSDLEGACGGLGNEVVYEVRIDEPTIFQVNTNNTMTVFNTVLYLRGADCDNTASEVACNDNIVTGNVKSALSAELSPGVYYLVVDGQGVAATGAYALAISRFAGLGSSCAMAADCGPGLVCRIPMGETDMQCAHPVCSDDADEDGDGEDGYPTDPGCSSPADSTETDDCGATSPVACPACSDGIDNDGDTFIDYLSDTGCTSAGQPVESCGTERDVMQLLTSGSVTDTMIGARDDFDPSCGSDGGPDKVFFADLPQMQTINFDTNDSSFDTVLALWPQSCGGTNLACDDDSGQPGLQSLLNRTNLAAGLYAVVVNAFSTSTTLGAFNLHVSGTIAPGGRCDGALAVSGALLCPAGYTCNGEICVGQFQCNNGTDDDADGKVDFPEEPGCTTPEDTTETDTCNTSPLGGMCPQCSDTQDNDSDGDTDFPDDESCASASANNETCPSSEAIATVTAMMTAGTTVGATNDVRPSCGSAATHTAPDLTYRLDLPAMKTITIAAPVTVPTWDNVLLIQNATCAGTPVSCTDNPTSTQTNLAAGTYFVTVDGFSTASGGFSLNVSGTIARGQRCDGALATANAITCDALSDVCKGPNGNKTCQPAACSDATDQDGDTFLGFPSDPGCASPADDDETDTCNTTGVGCPVCGNHMDDDGDSLVDFGSDFGCTSASAATEVFCATEADLVTRITAPTTSGTTAGSANNFTPTCGTSNAGEKTLALVLTVPVTTLTIDTNDSAYDTILSIRESTCATSIVCNDDGGEPDNQSKITRTNVAPGAYAIIVDGNQTATGGFFLNTKGIVASGAVCNDPLFTTGVLLCPAGESCQGATGAKICAP